MNITIQDAAGKVRKARAGSNVGVSLYQFINDGIADDALRDKVIAEAMDTDSDSVARAFMQAEPPIRLMLKNEAEKNGEPDARSILAAVGQLANENLELLAAVRRFQEMPPPRVAVAAPTVNVEAPKVDVAAPTVNVNVPEQQLTPIVLPPMQVTVPAPVVTIHNDKMIDVLTEILGCLKELLKRQPVINVAAPQVHIPEAMLANGIKSDWDFNVERGKDGRMTRLTATPKQK